MRRIALLASLASVAVLAFAAVADAHVLTFKRARNVAFNTAKQECNDIPTCQEYGAGPCERLNPHKIRCNAVVRDPIAQCKFYVVSRLVRGDNRVRRRVTPQNEWKCGSRQRVA